MRLFQIRFLRLPVIFFSSIFFLQASEEFNLPQFPKYPMPQTELSATTEEVIYFSSDSPVDFRSIFSGVISQPTTIKGELDLPEEASVGKLVPAMIILHGSGGIHPDREMMYAKYLAERGVATFLIDSYAARGVSKKMPYNLRILSVTEADFVADAYAALRILQTHPAIDAERIGLMGFSYGGMATRFSIDKRVHASLSKGLHPFALHIDFYGPCFIDLQTEETTGAPYISLRGALDESNDLQDCARIEDQLRRAGSSVGTRVFSKAGHGWEFPFPQRFIKTLNPRDCKVLVNDNGDFMLADEQHVSGLAKTRLEKILERSQIIENMEDICMADGYMMGRNDRAEALGKEVLWKVISSELWKGRSLRNVQAVTAKNGMVVAPEKLASRAGLAVLKNGGNAVDAAVTVGFALAVTYPEAGNIGGGGFMIVRDAKSEEIVALDYREKAPRAAHRDMFLDENGNVDTSKSRSSYLSVGVPGTVRGLALALEQYGTISLERALEPAIRLAEEGFSMSEELFKTLNRSSVRRKLLRSHASEIFYGEDGRPHTIGHIVVQKDLAWSLRQIARFGPDAFYEGEIARKIVEDMQLNGGLVSIEDLKEYRAVVRKPINGSYRGYEIYSMPPPSSGGVHIVQMLKMLDFLPKEAMDRGTVGRIHNLAEVMKRAYADRSEYLGDADFYPVPVDKLTSFAYVVKRLSDYNANIASPSRLIGPGNIEISYESPQTTHFSIVDRWGNAVSNTYTLNYSFGSCHMAEGTGILLNNEMDDFSAKPGMPNAYGLVGGEANAIEPQKRMLSSMSPTIVLKDNKVFLVTGSPGGSTIITTVLQVILNVIDHEMTVEKATRFPRVHHQWLPDELRIEKNSLLDVQIHQLEKMGHQVREVNLLGYTQSILVLGNEIHGFSDLRGEGGIAIGF